MKKYIFFLIFFLFFAQIIQAGLEVDYPQIGNILPPSPSSKPEVLLKDYILYVFRVSIILSTILAFLSLIIGGIKYLTSFGNVPKLSDAKDQIFSAFLGLFFLLSSYLLLSLLHTSFVEISPKELPLQPDILEEGLWLCPDDITYENFSFENNYLPVWEKLRTGEAYTSGGQFFPIDLPLVYVKDFNAIARLVRESCYHLSASGEVPPPVDLSTKIIYILGNYAAVLHTDYSFQGGCLVVYDKKTNVSQRGFYFGVKSVTLIKRLEEKEKKDAGPGVTFYQYRDFNEGRKDQKSVNFSNEVLAPIDPIPIQNLFSPPNGNVNLDPCYSIKIDKEKKWVAVAFENPPPPDPWLPQIVVLKCEVFDLSDTDLSDNYVATFCRDKLTLKKYPCVWGAIIIKGFVFEGPRE